MYIIWSLGDALLVQNQISRVPSFPAFISVAQRERRAGDVCVSAGSTEQREREMKRKI